MTSLDASYSDIHVPVLLKEVLEYLDVREGKEYLDCTFGAGGYSRAILSATECSLTAIDQDPSVIAYADQLKDEYKKRFNFISGNFAEANDLSKGKVFDGIVMDLGVSSMQLDNGERGFSFMHDGPLDMRMSKNGMSAADFINSAEEEQIADVIYRYGEEHSSRRIARAIVYERALQPIETTGRLADIVRKSCGFKRGKIDQATKTFQGLRIYINQELAALENFLERAASMLVTGGRLVIVSFHSLEDGIVKSFLRDNSPKTVARSKYKAAPAEELEGKNFKILTKKAIFPNKEETARNPRSRSARLRAAEKIGG